MEIKHLAEQLIKNEVIIIEDLNYNINLLDLQKFICSYRLTQKKFMKILQYLDKPKRCLFNCQSEVWLIDHISRGDEYELDQDIAARLLKEIELMQDFIYKQIDFKTYDCLSQFEDEIMQRILDADVVFMKLDVW